MPTQVQLLRELVGAGNTTSDDDLEANLESAVELLGKYLTDNGVPVTDVPRKVMERATRAVAREMFNQDEAPNGFLNQQFDDGTAAPVRVGADPLRPAYPLLGMWVDPVSIA